MAHYDLYYYVKIVRTAAFGCIFLAIQRRVVAFTPSYHRPSSSFGVGSVRRVGASSQLHLDRRRTLVDSEAAPHQFRSADEGTGTPKNTIANFYQVDNGAGEEDHSVFSIDSFDSQEFYGDFDESNNHHDTLVVHADPSKIGFVFPEAPKRSDPSMETQTADALSLLTASPGPSSYYPFAAMMQGSARYIADHAGKVVVFHIPGELLEDTKASDALLQDIALCWLLDMKIVIVAGCRLAQTNECAPEQCHMEYAHEVSSALVPCFKSSASSILTCCCFPFLLIGKR